MPLGGSPPSDWPELEDLKLRLNLDSTDDNDGQLEVLLITAITWAKGKRGRWDEMSDVPNESLANAALQRALYLATGDESWKERAEASLYGQRQRFGIA
jgi:hypothetical protein